MTVMKSGCFGSGILIAVLVKTRFGFLPFLGLGFKTLNSLGPFKLLTPLD